ncbi:hypothetical protein HNR63_000216 [Anoxybacillus kamchatkensis]|uniref:hypothetical protein n=1 Tax=Anoxybacillus ayderensis TaxID=265546 RepID=UPI0015EB392C|nr:hypothetical protein [Anoxybacillus ayderensis]MBA2877189.1 hypothetical protein [Anoxybacillus ayderensis]
MRNKLGITFLLAIMLVFVSIHSSYATGDSLSALKQQVKKLIQQNNELKKEVKSLRLKLEEQKKLEKGIKKKNSNGTLKSIKVVTGGVDVYIDGNLFRPISEAGSVVETITYENDVYVPVTAFVDALTNHSKQVTWTKDKKAVYIGKEPNFGQKDITELLEPYNYSGNIFKGTEAAFKILDKSYYPFNRFDFFSSWDHYTYMLHSKYSQLRGQFVIPYKYLGEDDKATLKFYSVNKRGEKSLIGEYSTETGKDPMEVEVDVVGVDILRIECEGDYSVLYNVTLAGIE